MTMLKPPFFGYNMETLYKNVLSGRYEKISIDYSLDLNNMIKKLLQVAPNNRPTANEILQMPEIIIRNKFVFDDSVPELLNTIRISNDLQNNLAFSFPESK